MKKGTMKDQQMKIIFNAFKGLVFGSIYLYFTYSNITIKEITENNIEKFLFTLECILPAIFFYMLSIWFVAITRISTSEETIQGNNTKEINILSSCLNNTLEQLIIAVPVWFILSIHLSSTQIKLIPCLVSLWIIARIFFYFGYVKSEEKGPGRALGFILTFVPTIISMFYCLYKFNL